MDDINPRNLAKNAKPKQKMRRSLAAMEGSGEVSEKVPSEENLTPRQTETGGPKGLEPTRYGDWERKGRCIDF